MKHISPKIKGIIIPLAILLIAIIVTKILSLLSVNDIERNWENISKNKYDEIKSASENLLFDYEDKLSVFTSRLLSNKKLISYINTQNIKKAYENLNEQEDISKYNIEIYNQRLELILFSGRQIQPEISGLQKAFLGNNLERIEQFGTVTYLVNYAPIKTENPENERNYPAVLVVSRILDVKNLLNEELYSETGISDEFKNRYGVKVNYFFENSDYYNLNKHISNNPDFLTYDIKSHDPNILCSIELPVLNIRSYQLEINERYSFILSLMLFAVSIFIIILIFLISARLDSSVLRLTIAISTLVVFRYLFLWIEFPSRIFTKLNINIFSPVFFASDFGFGIAKSLGELLITAAFIPCSLFYI